MRTLRHDFFKLRVVPEPEDFREYGVIELEVFGHARLHRVYLEGYVSSRRRELLERLGRRG